MIHNNQSDFQAAIPWDEQYKNVAKVPQEVEERRMSICNSCPLFDKVLSICYSCGCYMKTETKIAHASCPQEKWHPHPY